MRKILKKLQKCKRIFHNDNVTSWTSFSFTKILFFWQNSYWMKQTGNYHEYLKAFYNIVYTLTFDISSFDSFNSTTTHTSPSLFDLFIRLIFFSFLFSLFFNRFFCPCHQTTFRFKISIISKPSRAQESRKSVRTVKEKVWGRNHSKRDCAREKKKGQGNCF